MLAAKRITQSWIAINMILIFHLAILVLSNPVTRTSRAPVPSKQPAARPASSEASTLIVTNDNNRRSPPPTITTRDGERDVGPTSRSTNSDKRQAKKLPRAGAESMFSETSSDYPEEEIKRLLKQTPSTIKDLYNMANTQLDPNTTLTERTFMGHHHMDHEDGQAERDEPICRSKTRNILPREAPRQNSLVYIPNTDDFVQVIQAEICQDPDQECRYLQDSLPYGMTSYCSQKYAYKKLLYLDPVDNRMASDLFRYPSCCSCHIRTLPFDLRSFNNTNRTVMRQPSLNSHEEVPNVSQSLGQGPDSGGGSPTNQTTDRSQDPKPQSSSQQRTSKQVRRPTNQTLVLSDDKVYDP